MLYSACKLNKQGDNIQPWCTPFPILSQSLNTVFSSVAQLCLTLQSNDSQHARPPCPSPTPRVHPNPCPLSRWCHPTISSSVVLFSCIVLYWNKQNLPCSLTSFYLGIKLCIAQEDIGWTCSSPGTLKAAIYISTKMQIDDYRTFSVRFGEKMKERAYKHSTSENVDLLQWGVSLSINQLGPPYSHFKLC